MPQVILVEDLCKPTEVKKGVVHIHQIRVGPSWMDSIMLFLKKDILSKEKSEVDKVRRKAPQYWLSENQKLYKCSFSELYLLCIHPEASKLLLKELHEGICESHTGGRSLSHRALTQKDAQEYVKKCDQCQIFAPNIRAVLVINFKKYIQELISSNYAENDFLR